jgi:hypothetical protein
MDAGGEGRGSGVLALVILLSRYNLLRFAPGV